MIRFLFSLLLMLNISACTVGPDYVRPQVETPAAYKESGDWKPAEPRDDAGRGRWWEIFGDAPLDALLAQVEVSNQTIAAAEAQLRQAGALARQARAGGFPSVTGTLQETRSRSSANTGPSVGAATETRTSYSLPVTVSWEADLWGRIRRSVEQGEASAQASAADLVNARLSVQAELAQSYFQLRALDSQKQLLEATVAAYARTLELTRNRYTVGVVARADVAQAETQLQSTRAQALDLGVPRVQLEHAIAVLLGKPAASFSLASAPLAAVPPRVPAGLPAELLERRPDIAAAERRVAAANAQIGVARAAFFPAATLGASFGFQASAAEHWFTLPSRFWSVGPALALTLFDGGRREAVSDQAVAAYDASVAAYRGTVLAAFREVEDNLAALRILEQEAEVQAGAVRAAEQSLELAINQYKAGIVTYLQVVQAQTAALSNQRAAADILGRRVAASVLLVKALGGGWDRASQR
jgi:NodT family efflux transporter outer membrane factor (OMF) lipoprotein